jgi:hypothetical protein
MFREGPNSEVTLALHLARHNQTRASCCAGYRVFAIKDSTAELFVPPNNKPCSACVIGS